MAVCSTGQTLILNLWSSARCVAERFEWAVSLFAKILIFFSACRDQLVPVSSAGNVV